MLDSFYTCNDMISSLTGQDSSKILFPAKICVSHSIHQSSLPLIIDRLKPKVLNLSSFTSSKAENYSKMSFIGTQEKCKACEKTVYPMELLSADGVTYHKSCFKCNHCKGTLKISSFSSIEGVVYCKPHFQQLFKETGSYNKSFQSPAKSAEKLTPELTRSPSKASRMFSGTQDKCAACSKTVYPLEKVSVESLCYHKICFKCSHGGCSLSPSNYAALDGVLYCKPHFSQLFKEKGSYNHVLRSASMKRPVSTVPDS